MNAMLPTNLVDMLVDTVCVVDKQGRFVFLSASCERLLGYTAQELLGRNMIELVHPEDRERTLSAADHIMAGQPQTHFENRYVRKDGRIVHIMWSAQWAPGDGLRVAVARDVTERKRSEQLKNALYSISEAAHTVDGQYELYGHIHQIIAELLPAEDFSVALYGPERNLVNFPYVGAAQPPEGKPQPLGDDPLLAEVIHSGRARLASTADGALANWLGVPLIARDQVIGALVVRGSAQSTRYTEDDKELLQFVSTQIATAIERKQAANRLQHMARHDALTDLPNRSLFHDRFEAALQRARREGTYLGLLYLDLNDFKHVNDLYGHEIGDRLLIQVAKRLSGCVRASDTVGRMGGDEFTVLLTNVTELAGIGLVAEKIHAALAESFELDGRTLRISASIGSAVYPEHGDGREQLLRQADAGMYAVKRCYNQSPEGI